VKTDVLSATLQLVIKESIMANQYKNPRTEAVWDDLDAYLLFCQNYGYRYNPEDLYNNKKYPYQQFRKYTAGKNCKNMWEEDAKRMNGFRPRHNDNNRNNNNQGRYNSGRR
jgi:hypothetical protein